MFKLLMISIVILPILMGILAAQRLRGGRGLPILIWVFFLYCFAYMVMLRYLYYRWGAL